MLSFDWQINHAYLINLFQRFVSHARSAETKLK